MARVHFSVKEHIKKKKILVISRGDISYNFEFSIAAYFINIIESECNPQQWLIKPPKDINFQILFMNKLSTRSSHKQK